MGKPPFRKILVANRGEIALRVFRTCAEHNIRTVAVYSDADAQALHTSQADEAVHIGPAAARESYLKIEKIIKAALQTKADAIHPGYGFLSEQAGLAEACMKYGITWIGPPPKAMDVMGDKVRARQAVAQVGVPVVPGVDEIATSDEALAVCEQIGFPLMLKAAAGGGGKGMRIVAQKSELARAFDSASREAIAAFGDGRLLLERAILQARHVEIQLMADRHGQIVYLNERDCSIQRRHQKVMEECPSPSPQMSPEIRAAMGKVAVQVARRVDYCGAGTVEFLFEETSEGPRFYFLEMNTRLQVEHPITELTTGRDLVWDQIRVAAGLPLGYSQADVGLYGHALECRIYAEDPVHFLPSPGLIRRLVWPLAPHLRIDAAVAESSEVSNYYDPMIAKVVTWGRSREQALARMREALKQTVILGIQTNLAFHLQVLDEPDFNRGVFSTRYIEQHQPQWSANTLSEQQSQAIAAAAAWSTARALQTPTSRQNFSSRWRHSATWRA